MSSEISENPDNDIPTNPITPGEVLGLKEKLLPGFVMRTWNRLIAQNMQGKTSFITQAEMVKALENFCSRKVIFELGYLEVDEIYKKAGWKVKYDRPGFNETYEPFWEFTAK
jgi:hypothetical protein